MKIRLQISLAPDTAMPFEHIGPVVRIGRNPDGELPIHGEASKSVSWDHARIDLSAEGAWLLDLNSTNGILLNDRPVEGPQQLRVGDHFQLGYTGPMLTVVEVDSSPEPVVEVDCSPEPVTTRETDGFGTREPDGHGAEWSNLLKPAPEEPPSPTEGPLPARVGRKSRWLPGVILGAVVHLLAAAVVLYLLFGRPARRAPDTRPGKMSTSSKIEEWNAHQEIPIHSWVPAGATRRPSCRC